MKNRALLVFVTVVTLLLAGCTWREKPTPAPDAPHIASAWYGRITLASAPATFRGPTEYRFRLIFDSLSANRIHGRMVWTDMTRTVWGTFEDGRLDLMDEDGDRKLASIRGTHLSGTDKNGTWTLEADTDVAAHDLYDASAPPAKLDPRGTALRERVATLSAAMLLYLLPIVVGFWGIFEKADQPGWAALVPIYGYSVLLRVAGRSQWWLWGQLLCLVAAGFWQLPFLGGLIGAVAWVLICQSLASFFGRGTLFALGLCVLPVVFVPVLGFDRSRYCE